jgi:hypothetical protein
MSNYSDTQSYASTMLETLHHYGFDRIILIGDSVTLQTNAFVVCDAVRDGVLLRKLTPTSHFVTNVLGYEYELELDNGSIFNILKTQLYHSPSITSNDTIDFEINYKFYINYLYSFDIKSSNSVVVLNMGLHLNTPERIQATVLPLARAMIDYAKQHRNNIYLFRETTAQHFHNTEDGFYDARKQTYLDPDCCGKSSLEIQACSTDVLIQEALNTTDSKWEDYIGWVSLFKATQIMHDMHVELSRGVVDCSHYTYSPHVWNPLWFGIKRQVDRLMNRTTTMVQ